MPYDGVLEHNYVLQTRITKARTGVRDLCIAWLDITNAFGSISHDAISTALQAAGAGVELVEIIQDIYKDSTMSFLTSEGSTSDIPCNAGVKQGCPLSGLLFNLVVNPILENVQCNEADHQISAFCDDLSLMASDPISLQNHLDKIVDFASKLSLTMNPSKSFSLHLAGRIVNGSRVQPTGFFLDGVQIQPLAEFESVRFLGKPVGFHVFSDTSALREKISVSFKLMSSKLDPWQRIDAMKTFFFSSLVFSMCMVEYSKTEWQALDNTLRPLFKETLYVPVRGSNDYLYGSSSACSRAIHMAIEYSEIF